MVIDQWFYAHGGERIGPVPFEALRAMAGAGTLKPQDLVWQDGMADWAPAATIPNLMVTPTQTGQGQYHPNFAAPLGYAGPAPVNYYTPPQHSVVYAGFWLRFAAFILDSILLVIATGIFGFILGFGLGFYMARSGYSSSAIQSAASLMGNVMGLVVIWLYNAFMESSPTQGSLGKMALGIKVTDMNGGRISFLRATGRHFGQFISWIIIGIGFIIAGLTEKKQALHDLLAGCLVVRK